MNKNMQKTDLPALCVAQKGILVMFLIAGFMGACNEPAPVSKPAPVSNPPLVKDLALASEQTEGGSVPTILKITLTKEVKAVKVDGHEATGYGMDWNVKLETLKLEAKIPDSTTEHGQVSGIIPLYIAWTNTDGTEPKPIILTVDASAKVTNTNGALERQLTSVSLIYP